MWLKQTACCLAQICSYKSYTTIRRCCFSFCFFFFFLAHIICLYKTYYYKSTSFIFFFFLAQIIMFIQALLLQLDVCFCVVVFSFFSSSFLIRYVRNSLVLQFDVFSFPLLHSRSDMFVQALLLKFDVFSFFPHSRSDMFIQALLLLQFDVFSFLLSSFSLRYVRTSPTATTIRRLFFSSFFLLAQICSYKPYFPPPLPSPPPFPP